MANTRMDYYKVLEIPRDAKPDEIKAAYKKMALKWHPDRHLDDTKGATEKFVEINKAYRALTRERRRAPNRSNIPSKAPAPRPSSPTPVSSKSSSSSSSSGSNSSHHQGSETCTTPPSSPKHAHFDLHATEPTPHAKSRSDGLGLHAQPKPSTPNSTSTTAPRCEPPTSPKLGRTKLRKQSKPAPHHDFEPPKPAPKRRKSEASPRNTNETKPLHPEYVSPLSSRGTGTSKEWLYALRLTLEELAHGKHFRFRLTRYLLSNKKRDIILELDVPPGCRPGTKILCRGVGHEYKDAGDGETVKRQDVIFIIEEAAHERFTRVMDDLLMDVRLPWLDSLETELGEVCFNGVNGEEITVQIDFPKDRMMKGRTVIVGAGMPIREGGEVTGRGDLVVRWEIIAPPHSKWESLKKALHLKK